MKKPLIPEAEPPKGTEMWFRWNGRRGGKKAARNSTKKQRREKALRSWEKRKNGK